MGEVRVRRCTFAAVQLPLSLYTADARCAARVRSYRGGRGGKRSDRHIALDRHQHGDDRDGDGDGDGNSGRGGGRRGGLF